MRFLQALRERFSSAPAGLATDEAEVFEEGTYPQGTYTAAELDAIAARYNPAEHEAPSITDHSAEGAVVLGQRFRGPAYGWVAGLRTATVQTAEGPKRRLIARFSQVPEEFRELYRSGRFKKPSVEFMRNKAGERMLAAVAWLGAQTPGVKGLRPAHFANGEEGEMELIASDFEARAAFAASGPRKTTEDEMDETKVKAMVDAAVGEVTTRLTEQFGDALGVVNTEAKARIDALEARATTAETTLAAERLAARRREVEAFADEQVAANRLPPGQRDKTVDLMLALAGAEIAEGDKKRPAVELFREVFAALPDRMPLGEHGGFREAVERPALKLKGEDGIVRSLVIPAGADPASSRFAEAAAGATDAASYEDALLATSAAHPDLYR